MAWPSVPAEITNGQTSDASHVNNLRTALAATITEATAQLAALEALIESANSTIDLTVSETEPENPADNAVWIVPGGIPASASSSLQGTWPNPVLRASSVGTDHLVAHSVTADKLATAIAPLVARVTASQTLTAATDSVAVDIADLVFDEEDVPASSVWLVLGMIRYQAGATGDLELVWDLPTGAEVYGNNGGPNKGVSSINAATANFADVAGTDTNRFVVGGTGTTTADIAVLRPVWTIVMGATTGDLQLTGMQETTNATKPIILPQSVLLAFQVA